MTAGGFDFAEFADSLDQISSVLNGIKNRLIADGWHEHNAERAAVALLNSQRSSS